MRTFSRGCWCATALILAFAGTTAATDWVVAGTADGYTLYRGDPHFWKGNDAYTRTLYTQPAYSSYGVYYPARQFYQYHYSYTYQPPAVDGSYAPGWQDRLLRIAEARDKYVAKAALAQQDHAHYLEAVQALGLQGNFRWEGYGLPGLGLSPGYGHQSYQRQAAGVGAYGNTQYGYGVREVAEFYGDTSPNLLYQQAARLAQSAQQLGGQATTDFSNLVGQEGSNRARVAEVLARGAAAAATLKATEPQASSRYEKSVFQAGGSAVDPSHPQPAVEPIPAPGVQAAPQAGLAPVRQQLRAAWKAQADARCASCHGPQDAKGGFQVSRYPDLTPAQRLKVVGRLTTDDQEKLMPRSADGHAGKRLTDQEIQVWLSVY